MLDTPTDDLDKNDIPELAVAYNTRKESGDAFEYESCEVEKQEVQKIYKRKNETLIKKGLKITMTEDKKRK